MIARAVVFAALAFVAACATSTPLSTMRLAEDYADYLIGRTADLRDDYAAAADRYFAALERSPRDAVLIEGALNASLAMGDVERARRAASLASGNSTSAPVRLVRAADALRNSNWRAANDELARAEGAADEELLAHAMQLWADAGRGRVESASLQGAPFSPARPFGGLLAYQQAMALDVVGRDEEALRAYALASEGGLNLPSGVLHHAGLLWRLDRGEEAAAILRAALASSRDPALAAALARLEAGQRPPSQLVPAQGAAISLYGLGAILAQERATQSALVAFTLARMLDPDFDLARIAFAEAQADLGRSDIARSALEQIGPTSPYHNKARIAEAWLLLDQEQEEEALSMVRALADDADARRALADMYSNLDRFAEAEPIYSELISAHDDNWRFFFLRGAARERLRRWHEAEADLRRALALAPNQPEVLNYLGYSLIEHGENLAEAMSLVERAVVLRPDSGAILDSLGWGYYRQANYNQAVLHLERAVELEPADPTLNDHLGDVYWRLGRRIEARYQWRRALSLSPEEPAIIEAKLERGLPPSSPARLVRP